MGQRTARNQSDSGRYASLDSDHAVQRADSAPKVQHRHYSYEVALPKSMMGYCNLDQQSLPLDVRLVKGIEPVVVDGPAIVVRPIEGSR